jgi:hypothetical protein
MKPCQRQEDKEEDGWEGKSIQRFLNKEGKRTRMMKTRTTLMTMKTMTKKPWKKE